MFKSKKLLNRFMAILVIIMIAFLVIDSDLKQAYALPVPTAPWVPVVIEGGKATASGTIATVGGMTVGGTIAVCIGIIAVAAGVIIAIDNWEDITYYIKNQFEQNAFNEWWNNIATNAVYIYDPTRTLKGDIEAGNIDVDIYDYVLKEGTSVTIPQDIYDTLSAMIGTYKGYESLKSGTYNDFEKKLKDIMLLNSINPQTLDLSYKNYNYYLLRMWGENITGDLMLCASNTPFYFQVKPYNFIYTNYEIWLNGGSNVKQYYYYKNNTYPPDINERSYVNFENRVASRFGGYDITANQATWILLTNSDITLENTYTGVTSKLAKGSIEYTIDPSLYKYYTPVNNTYSPNSILVNPQTIQQLKQLDLKDIPNTDKLNENIATANKNARDNGYEIIDKQIVGQDEEIPIDTDPIPNPNPTQWYDIILNPLKEFARWLFVPDSVVINQLVNDIQNKMDQQAGLLTYPLTLVIRFLMEVYQLDVTDCILHIPRMEIFGYVLYEGCYYNLTQEIHKSDYAPIYSVYMYFTDFVLIIGFISLCIKKGDEMLKGGISPS